jgi:nucleoside-diphosphate-sugar epimerase
MDTGAFMALEANRPLTLLLGGGYTLQRVADKLPVGSFIITSRSEEQCARWRQRGWLAYQLDNTDQLALARLFAENSGLQIVVDSVPPLRTGPSDIRCNSDNSQQGVRSVVQAISNTAVKRIIYLSTTGVFGVRDGSWVDESTAPAPWNSQGAARLASEETYREGISAINAAGAKCAFTALRLPAIYGPDRGVAVSLRMGTYHLVGDGSQWTNRIHVEDLATIILRCIEFRGVLPPVICVNDDYPTQARDVVLYICGREKLPMPPSVSADEVLKRGAYTMLSNQRVRNSLMKAVLGVSLKYPSFREGT